MNLSLTKVVSTLLIEYIGYEDLTVNLLIGLKLYIILNSFNPGFFSRNSISAPYSLIPLTIIPTTSILGNVLFVKARYPSKYFRILRFTRTLFGIKSIVYLIRSEEPSSLSLVINISLYVYINRRTRTYYSNVSTTGLIVIYNFINYLLTSLCA